MTSTPLGQLRLQIHSLKHDLKLARTEAATAPSKYEITIERQQDRITSLQIELAVRAVVFGSSTRLRKETGTWSKNNESRQHELLTIFKPHMEFC